ncbi:MAPEG family protein [Pseudoalteromonas sp. T1lg65]|uniref:MAPEG family protein n=1 Tax=Pseudoalteromonas sp. T1lg65 TaxID=2077101 RepID=UPI003F7A7F15
MITGFFAALLTLIYIKLSFDVIKLRKGNLIALGDGGNSQLQAAIRAHGNFSEYTPITLILLFILEFQTINPIWLYVLGSTFIIARLAHYMAIKQANIPMRQVGMALTYLVMLVAMVINFVLYISHAF